MFNLMGLFGKKTNGHDPLDDLTGEEPNRLLHKHAAGEANVDTEKPKAAPVFSAVDPIWAGVGTELPLAGTMTENHRLLAENEALRREVQEFKGRMAGIEIRLERVLHLVRGDDISGLKW